ncbi:MAG: aldo/keto reductase [Deltaproteobacteria bacterium]|nr:aldo/keto reductase [Deltaproteobacteria bacterium]
MITGRASGEATEDALSAVAPRWRRRLGATGLHTAALGFGTYRVDEADGAHLAALDQALAGGIRLVDTAVNYGLGGAERAVGLALARGVEAGRLQREGVIVVSKVGYWQGEMLEWLRRSGDADPRAVASLSPDHAHALGPALIRHAASVSRGRLGLETLDVLLLHNPEYLLDPGPDALREASGAERRAAFEATILQAFRTLEELVGEGAIAWYGVSSNSLGARVEQPGQTTVSAFVEAAEQAARSVGARQHHLALLQAPVNLLEARGAEAAAEAARHGLAFLANRPLNAVTGGALVRLAAPGPGATTEALSAARKALRRLEAALDPGGASAFPRWSHELPGALTRLATALDFDDFRTRYADPRTEAALEAVQPAGPRAGVAVQAWRAEYRRHYEALMGAARGVLAARDAARLEALAAPLDDALPEALRAGPLSRRALAFAATRPGVTAALCGMRREAWVDEALALLRSGA